MDFGWSATERDLYERTMRFVQDRLGHKMSSSSARGPASDFDREAWRRLGEFGLLGLCAPEPFGLGLSALATAHAMEAFGRSCDDMGFVFSAAAHLFTAVMPIAEHGSDALRQAMLPRLCSGEWVGANAITEPDAGSDAFALRTRATRDGDSYVLDGTKSYVTNGPVADVIVVYATINPEHGFLGVTAIAVEKDTPGLVVGKPFEKLGLTTSPISSVYFERCRVPVSHRIGGEGQGAAIFKASMLWERSCLFAMYLGLMDRQIEVAVDYAQRRRQFGRAIGKNQAIAHRIADMKLRLESARLLVYRACWLKGLGEDATQQIALAKLAVSEAAVQSGLDLIQIHGGIGVMEESGIARMLRDAVPSTIFSGTSEIQRELVAGSLGL
ncbi:MAG TPA: acyl-CoA dehydrogenase family protein [Kofleriaceae bacterium]